jgi:hypothetical protein
MCVLLKEFKILTLKDFIDFMIEKLPSVKEKNTMLYLVCMNMACNAVCDENYHL